MAEAAPMAGIAAQQPEPPAELPEVMEELLIEEVSIDGMCGVY
ncbi:MAG: mycofactocin precursor MftA [Candidatus Competibacteraceae bacterium]|nr:mycofactocin precursor MftA [Candidatus Competibacteraceae bacterium]MCP5134115.1 mycofactocin precursor [Gammaproteobacteria bacterium]